MAGVDPRQRGPGGLVGGPGRGPPGPDRGGPVLGAVVGGAGEGRGFPWRRGGSAALPPRHRGAGGADAVPAGRGEQRSVDSEVVTWAQRVDPRRAVPRLEVFCWRDNGVVGELMHKPHGATLHTTWPGAPTCVPRVRRHSCLQRRPFVCPGSCLMHFLFPLVEQLVLFDLRS